MSRNPTAVAVRVVMARKGLTQQDLANALGVSQAAISRRLKGAVSFTADELHQIAERFDVSPAELIGTLATEEVPA